MYLLFSHADVRKVARPASKTCKACRKMRKHRRIFCKHCKKALLPMRGNRAYVREVCFPIYDFS